ncbi:hypothetical protein Goarm_009150 [Gossypium armourianum]|uniref:Uncharacterized protein n=1 Tax=Gossypium armourianum TaxID=34283 RepID=A0A7J9JS11_9ROSI|nr:hypothetical protein [Gossypium armourianum]
MNHTGTLRENSGLAFNTFGGVESCHGKSGSISFHGLTHQLVEESKLMSAAFQEDKGSFLWVLAPIALISSLILPQFFFSSAIEAFFKDDTLVVFLLVTDHVQRPYLQFSAKRWGLITGLRTSQFSMKDSQRTPEMFKRGGATAGMVITFQVLAVVCLWSLMAFLQRLFPSRPVAEKY